MSIQQMNRNAAVPVSFLLSLLLIVGPCGAEVFHTPVTPSHEDMVWIRYEPEPSHNTTKVNLVYAVDGGSPEQKNMTFNRSHSLYEARLGAFPPGTRVDFNVTASQLNVGGGALNISSVVEPLWHKDLEEAKSISRVLERPLLVFFYSDGDDRSHEMEEETFHDEGVLNLSAEFVMVKIDVDSNSMTYREWDLLKTPTVVFIECVEKGTEEVHRVRGPVAPSSMMDHMEYTLGRGPTPETGQVNEFPNTTHLLVSISLVMLGVIGIVYVLVRFRRDA